MKLKGIIHTGRTIQITYELDFDGDSADFTFPGRYEVCSRCDGRGSHVNPAVDGHGISAEEWENDWSPEEQEGYFRGDYDVPCEECGGKRVVPVVDEESSNPEDLAILRENQRMEAEYRRERAAELRWGY